MLIIFDLDDTLIDTSGCITPYKLKLALETMVNKGLNAGDFAIAWHRLQQIDRRSLTSREALEEFLENEQEKNYFLQIGLEIMQSPLSDELILFPADQALEVLRELKEHHLLALVTIGESDLQRQKMKKAGIEETLFCKIVVAKNRDKKPHYQALAEEFNVPPHQVIVCGDRIRLDLSPAKELGFKTIHILQGRGKISFGPREHVDYTISKLGEIKNIFQEVNV